MKVLLQSAILITVLLITLSEGIFFERSKKILSDFIHSLKAKKKSHDIQHYHYHYYPVILFNLPTKAPKKYELETIHNEHLATLGWGSHEYKYVPEPKIKIFPSVFNSWKDPLPWEQETPGESVEINLV